MHFLFFVLLNLALPAVSTSFYVSTEGSDTNDGSQNSPFQTLHRAQSAVRSALTSQTEDIYVHVAKGLYELSQPVNLTSLDSGQNGHNVIWKGEEGGVNISGGTLITNWSIYDPTLDVYNASVPANSVSRHLYANQVHAQRARQGLDRTWLSNTTDGYQVSDSRADFLLTLEGIEHGEIRGINSFTDRYIPVEKVVNDTLIMQQPAFQNNIIGYDTIINPFYEGGFFIENVLALLDEENEFYLNASTNTVYYKPPNGTNPNDMNIVLPKLEQLIIFSGTYDDPVHDITISGFNFMHTTWNYPSSNVGYADQQTGAYIGLNQSYDIFESTRPFWWQVPGSVQLSAAHDITITNGSMVAIMGGFGIGNDANAHTSGIGLGAQNIVISDFDFSQTGHNCITAGGVQADAHHPSDVRMTNSNISVKKCIFRNNSITYTSGVPIFFSYIDGSQIVHNDISNAPYSGICYGYGWGSNDAGGSDEYARRGLYNYQPRYTTPTTEKNGLIKGNLIHDYGQMHTDLGGIYTLADSPNTTILENYIYSPNGDAHYHDEGSRSYISSHSVFNTSLQYLQRNEQPLYTTGNLTLFSINTNHQPSIVDETNQWGDHLYNITYSTADDLPLEQKRVVYNAGIPQKDRKERDVSVNPVAAYLQVGNQYENGTVTVVMVELQNLGRGGLEDVRFESEVETSGWEVVVVGGNATMATRVEGFGVLDVMLQVNRTDVNAATSATVDLRFDYLSVVGREKVEKSVVVGG